MGIEEGIDYSCEICMVHLVLAEWGYLGVGRRAVVSWVEHEWFLFWMDVPSVECASCGGTCV